MKIIPGIKQSLFKPTLALPEIKQKPFAEFAPVRQRSAAANSTPRIYFREVRDGKNFVCLERLAAGGAK
jgi:hypothetical protein